MNLVIEFKKQAFEFIINLELFETQFTLIKGTIHFLPKRKK